MEGIVHTTVRLVRAAQSAYARRWAFLALSVSVFTVTVFLLARLDLLPDSTGAAASQTASVAAAIPVASTTPAVVSVAPEVPVKISIPSIGLKVSVANPTSTNNKTLDDALLSGAVRYPTSALLGQDNGNVVLFGHSSYLPVVNNPAYKTFDGIQKLHAGDTISVYAADTVYTYAVASVTKESAASDDGIPLQVTGKVLTLSTCDSFGAKTDRFVVVANFVESHSSVTP